MKPLHEMTEAELAEIEKDLDALQGPISARSSELRKERYRREISNYKGKYFKGSTYKDSMTWYRVDNVYQEPGYGWLKVWTTEITVTNTDKVQYIAFTGPHECVNYEGYLTLETTREDFENAIELAKAKMH